MIHPATRDRAARSIPAGHRQIINDNPGCLKPPQPITAGALRQPLSTRAAPAATSRYGIDKSGPPSMLGGHRGESPELADMGATAAICT
jgi:hypothetical protein